jgi:putative oxidoreductase
VGISFRNRDAGLLVLRLGLGGFFIWAHGWPKLAGGVEKWRGIGAAMQHLGIDFWPVVWGFLATLAETLGAFLVAIGLFFKPACLALTITDDRCGGDERIREKAQACAMRACH